MKVMCLCDCNYQVLDCIINIYCFDEINGFADADDLIIHELHIFLRFIFYFCCC